MAKCGEADYYHYISDVYSPLRPAAWLDILNYASCWDFDTHFILDGVYNGFRVVDPHANIDAYDCKNYKSCFDPINSKKMNDVLLAELSTGKISITHTKPDQIHSLGAVPKPNGSVRHITDCSRPPLKSVNNFMKETFSSFAFNTIDDIVQNITPNCYMATVDLQDAYRSVPIHPSDRRHFGLRWDFGDGQQFLSDNFLCFGSKCSAFIFNRLTDAVTRYMRKKGFCCFNYLDDFIIIADTYQAALFAQNVLIQTLRSLGFYISWKKLTSPSQYCKFLGIIIDSVLQELVLPNDKMLKLHRELAFWENKTTSTKLQMQRLCGVLNFCCKVIRGGRVFMFHMIELLKLFNLRKRIELPKTFHDDISWWLSFAEQFNGRADFFDPVKDNVKIYTDACLEGLAAIFDGDYYQARVFALADDCITYITTTVNTYDVYVPVEHVMNINVLELIAVLLAMRRWSYCLINCRVILYCDNLQVCYNLAKDKTKNDLSNQCLRDIFWICISNNIYISPSYIPSSANIYADYLSRTVF